MMDPGPKGGGLPSADEIRKTSVLPTSKDQRFKEGWEVYLDNFAVLSVETIDKLRKAQDHVHRWHNAARDASEAWSIPSAADKSVSSSVKAT